MISVKELTNEATCDIINEDGQYSRAIPEFKKRFSRKTKEMWGMFENDAKHSNIDLVANINQMIVMLSTLKSDISIYSKNTGDIDDWV